MTELNAALSLDYTDYSNFELCRVNFTVPEATSFSVSPLSDNTSEVGEFVESPYNLCARHERR